MGNTTDDIFRHAFISVLAFGILGNILVIISILKQKRLFKHNYYFLVLHLAICDLGCCILLFLREKAFNLVSIFHSFITYCLVENTPEFFVVAGVYMMLIIAALRYRATVHPLKPKISRRKLKIVCSLGYILGLTAGYGLVLPACFLSSDDAWRTYFSYYLAYSVICFLIFPAVFMAMVYYKIGRALIKQNKQMKRVCSNAVKSRYVRNRRTFLVCLGTVLCFALSNVLSTVNASTVITGKQRISVWFYSLGAALRAAGWHAVNPIIYGMFDKKMLTFWKLCSSREWKQQENQASTASQGWLEKTLLL